MQTSNKGASSDNVPQSHSDNNPRETYKNASLMFQSLEEVQEMLLQELENLFDKPCLIPVVVNSATQASSQPSMQTPFKVGLEKDYTNTFLITNPLAIFKVFQKDQFLALPESTQTVLLDRLDDILQKCSHNSLVLTDHIVQGSVNQSIRIAKTAIGILKTISSKEDESSRANVSPKRHGFAVHQSNESNDFLHLTILLALKLSHKSPQPSRKLVELIRKLTIGRRFFRPHVEYLNQYLKFKCSRLALKGRCLKAMIKVDTAIKIMQNLFEQRYEIGPCNYFYFSGYLSGIQVNTKQLPQTELFSKGFAASMWFRIADCNMLQDDKNLPVLFNCFFQGHGGFECYFNQMKLFYRALPKNYTPPNVESNGVLIGEIQPKKWTFFAIEHDRPYLTRPQLTAILNDKQVVSQVMDYPRITDKAAKISMVVVCQNFVGQLSTFILFKDIINNTKKMIQIGQQTFEYGFYSQQQLQNLKNEIFDQKIIDKLLILYSPERTSNKMVYDCVELRDGELMINSGVCNAGPKSKIFYTGGLNSLLPLLELIQGISLLNKSEKISLDTSVNDFLKLVILVLQQDHQNGHKLQDGFFTMLFYLLTRLNPKEAVNSLTVSLLSDIRFHIGENSNQQEEFFHAMMRSSDFWVNSEIIEVINDFWLFVKAIYQQNPVTYNRIFSVQNLIDLMVKISEIRDGGHCCAFHKESYLMFYHQDQQNTTQNWVMLGKDESKIISYKVEKRHETNNHQIDKYLGPIAGVLEGVLTSGGNEVLDQIQYIAKALTVKTSSCFHLQMLKLLKVLLLDSKEDRQCASPADFAASFMKAKGMHILMYLCSHSSFDVKSMCVKLIDVLSSHTTLVKMAIDPDVITYLSSIMLPHQMMMESANRNKNNQMFNNLVVVEDSLVADKSGIISKPQQFEEVTLQGAIPSSLTPSSRDSQEDELERQMNQLLAKEPPMIIAKKDRKPKPTKFGVGLFLEDDEDQQNQKEDDSATLMQKKPLPSRFDKAANDDEMVSEELHVDHIVTPNNFMFPNTSSSYVQEIDNDDDLLLMAKPPPPAPKNRASKKGGGSMNFDFEEKNNKPYFKSSRRPLTIAEAPTNEEEEEDIINKDHETKSDEDLHLGDSMLQDSQYSNFANKKMMFTHTQKLPSSRQQTSIPKFKGKGLSLALNEDDQLPTKSSSFKHQLKKPLKIDNDDVPIQMPPTKRFVNTAFTASVVPSNEQEEEENFANENVMSKSNLRQPKSFNFGFPDSSSDSEEEKSSQKSEEAIEEIKKTPPPHSQMFKKKALPTLASTNFDDETTTEQLEDPIKGSGTTGATSDSENQVISTTLSNQEELKVSIESKTQKKNNVVKSTTASVNQKKMVKPLFLGGNQKLLNIDTDAINELFNYGGEKGQIMMSEDEEIKQLESEIEELATFCIAAMNRKKPTDPIKYENSTREKSSFESKYLKNEEPTNQKSKNPRKQFMTPQSVRGIKKIEFQMAQEEKIQEQNQFGISGGGGIIQDSFNIAGLKSATFTSQNTILEEISGGDAEEATSSSHSSSNKEGQDINFPGLLSSSIVDPFSVEKEETKIGESGDIVMLKNLTELPIDTNQNTVQFDPDHQIRTQEIENLYTSCLEWIISRAPSSLYENIVIDECDQVKFIPHLQLLTTLVTHSNNLIRQRALTDLEMLAKWDSNNGVQIMMMPQFHNWLLELLMPYQDMANKYAQLQGSALAVYDIGCKLHTVLLKIACINSEEEAYKKINFIARWPSIIQTQLSQGLKDRSERDVETAHKLSRVLITSLISSLKDEISRQKPKNSTGGISATWQNLLYISYLVEEMILGSHMKEIQGNDSVLDMDMDLNGQPLLKWIHDEGYLLYYNGSNEKSLWAEWDVLEALFSAIDNIYPDWTIKTLSGRQATTSTSIDESIYSLLEKTSSADEFNSIVELLMHDQSPYKASQGGNVQFNSSSQSSSQAQHSTPVKQSSKKGILGNVLGGFRSHKESDKNHTIQVSYEPQNQALGGNKDPSSTSYFMWNILNLLCIGVQQSDTKQQVSLWLDRFERFSKFVMIVSESWKSRLVSSLYQTYQKRFTEVITFAMTFLFHEIHATNRSSPTHQHSSFPFPGSTNSPKEDQMLPNNKFFSQSLKSIMIFFINILEYSRIKHTPAQLESHTTACRSIQMSILVKNSYQQQHGEATMVPLLRDISRFKQTDYEDFPECFYLDDWKVTFFKNQQVREIVRKQRLNNKRGLQLYAGKRQAYAQNIMDTQESNEKTKQDILQRIHSETHEIIGEMSTDEYERRNHVALLNDNFVRCQGYEWVRAKRLEIGNGGMWQCESLRKKMSSFKVSSDGTRCIMKECYGINRFDYFNNNPEFEQKIFGKEFTSLNNPNISQEFELFFLSESPWLLDHVKTPRLPAFKDNSNRVKPGPHHFFQNISQPHEDEDNTPKASDEDLDDEEEMQQLQKTSQVTKSSENSTQMQVVSFFSRLMTTREKQAMKKSYIQILKEQLYATKLNNAKHKEIISEIGCELLKPLFKRVGTATLTSHDIIFFDDLSSTNDQTLLPSEQQQGDNIFFFRYTKRPTCPLYKIIPLHTIKELQKRRFLGKKTALEMSLLNGKSLLFNFSTIEDRDHFAKKILRQRSQRAFNLKYYDTLEPRKILKKRELTEKWMNWKISNFEYICLLNQLSGRSYLDLSQYPVFPWIFVDFVGMVPPDITAQHNSMGAPVGFRDLQKNMQLLGSAERQAEFKKKYDDQDSFETLQERFHCGSHYSNPGIVLHYLSRVAPYLEGLVQLHGKQLDSPDRGFHSLQDSIHSALNDHADVRELIPEFFYCPELFINHNRINFGKKQDGEIVDDVKLPPWCQNDPYLFVIYMREAFESQYVSQNLNGWIDYIFGYKQKDQEAEKCLNTFSRVTYEDGVDLDTVSDPFQKQSFQEQIYNYGQTPSQLFSKQQGKHPARLPRSQAMKFSLVVDSQAKIKVYKPVVQQPKGQNQQQQQLIISQEAILRAKFVDDQTIVGLSKDGNVTYFFWLSKAHELNPNTPFTCCEDKKRKFDNQTRYQGLDLYDRSIKRFEFPLLIIGSQKQVLRGGFWCGKIQICPIEGLNSDPQTSMPQVHQSTVTALVSTQNEKIIISGSKSGDVVVYQAVPNPIGTGVTWNIRKHMCHHQAMVSYISINEEMNMYLTCSFDGTANLYNMQDDHKFQHFSHPNSSPLSACVLSLAPLPCIAFFSREDHFWYSYSLNNPNQMLERQREECSHMISPTIIKDSHHMDRLVYGTEKGYMVFRQLPLLKQAKKLQVSVSYPVLSLIVSPDRRFLLVGCGDGGLNVITEPFIAQQFGPQSSNLVSATATNTSSSVNSSFVQTTSISSGNIIGGGGGISYRE